jgi:hypothetical protein
VARRRYRDVTDLYVVGKVAELADGTPVWVQAMNPFEADAARNEASIAKARLTMALKEFGSDEQAKVKAFFLEDGHQGAVRRLVEARLGEAMPRIVERMRSNPDWVEKISIIERGVETLAKEPTPEEVQLLEKISTEYTEHINSALVAERDFLKHKYSDVEEEDLWADYLDYYLDRRGMDLQLAEYQLSKVYYGARWCEATKDEHGNWDHKECEGHEDRLFADRDAARRAPEALTTVLVEAADDAEMTATEAKNLDRHRSSQGSSPLPSAGEESTASTPSATPHEHPGSSSQPSLMP